MDDPDKNSKKHFNEKWFVVLEIFNLFCYLLMIFILIATTNNMVAIFYLFDLICSIIAEFIRLENGDQWCLHNNMPMFLCDLYILIPLNKNETT